MRVLQLADKRIIEKSHQQLLVAFFLALRHLLNITSICLEIFNKCFLLPGPDAGIFEINIEGFLICEEEFAQHAKANNSTTAGLASGTAAFIKKKLS